MLPPYFMGIPYRILYLEQLFFKPALVEPNGFTTSFLQRRHYYVNVIISKSEERFVRIYPDVRTQAVTYLIELLFVETTLLEHIIESVQCTQLLDLGVEM